MRWNAFWKILRRNWRAAIYLFVLAALAVLLVVVCVRRGQTAAQPDPTPRTSAAVQKDAAQTLLDGMSTREKICQLLIVHPEALTDGGTVTAMTDDLAAALRDYPVGGFLLSAGNMTSGEQLRALTSALSSACAAAPLVTVDEEGGRVARLMNTVGTTKLNSMYSYRSLGTQGAYDNAQTLAHDIAAYGFNTDFAPVADVWTNKRSNAIGDRAYSDDYDEAATLVSAAVHGFRDAGVICCLKHFPGHGSTATDSHNGAATVDKTLPQLRQEDLKPFVSGIAAGADMVMVGHLTVPTMDDAPASLSHKLVTNLLRYDLGFRGVIVTDGLQMQALAQYTDGEKAVRALAAGNDMPGMSSYPGAYRDYISVTAMSCDYTPAYYTNYGPGCNIAAPGGDAYQSYLENINTGASEVLSTVNGGKYGYMQGTSMACPHVSGVAALGLSYALQLGKTFTQNEFTTLLLTSVNDINQYCTGTKQYFTDKGSLATLDLSQYKKGMGTGYIDAYQVLMNVRGITCIPIPVGSQYTLNLQPYLGGGNLDLKITEISISAEDMNRLGISANPTIFANQIILKCTKPGSAVVRIKLLAGNGNNSGMNGMPITKEFAFIAREVHSQNGGWL